MNQYQYYDMSDGDEHSEDGQLRSPPYSNVDYVESNEEDTPDSLEIKPPQSIGRCEKPKKSYSSRSRSGKHSREYRHKERHAMRGSKHEARAERHHMSAPSNSRHGYTHKSNSREFRDPREQRDARNSRDGREVREQRDEREIRDARPQVEARPYQASANRYEKYRTDSKEQFTKINYSDREREKLRVKGYERKRVSPDKTDGERKLEDLRSKLLSKRSRHDIERNCEEHQNYQERELSRYEQNDSRRSEKDVHHQKYRSKKAQVEYIDSPENYADGDGDVDRISEKQRAPEDPELVARRAKLLDAEREMLKRKQLAREELKARREMQKEREDTDQVSPSEKDVRRHYRAVHRKKRHEPMEVVQISDNSDVEGKENDEESNYDEEESVSDSASNTNSEYSEEKSENELPASPLSVGELTKSDHRRHHDQTKSRSATKSKSRSRSPHRRESSRSPTRSRSPSRSPRLRNRSRVVTPTSDFEKEKPEENQNDDNKSEQSAKKDVSPESTLPSYFPGLQGCRSVEEFKCLNRIAEGTYGIVYRAQDKRTEEIVALKRLKMEKEKDGFPITSLREINTLLKGQHPNIVTVREIVVGSNMDKIFIVMDYVEHDFKTLMETMQHRKQSFLPGEVKCLTQQLLRAVAHLHDNWILHRDLKTSNLLLSHKGILKVGDFGLAREYGSPLKAYTSVVVTLWYRAPELLLCSKEYSTPIDMWSVGCIFAEFLAMQALFPGQSETDQLNKIFKFLGTPNETIWPGYGQLPAVQKIKFTDYPLSMIREKFGRRTSELGLSLLEGLLTYDPKKRFTADQALKSNYFKELPLPIDPAMFPTWPAKSELGSRKALASSPKPPSGGGQFKKLEATDIEESNIGFILGASMDARQLAMGGGFSLKF